MVAPPFISAAQGLRATVWDRRSSSIASFWFWTAGTAHHDQLVRVHIGAETHRYPVKLGAQFRLVWPRSPLMHLSGRSSGQVRDGQRQPEMARGSERASEEEVWSTPLFTEALFVLVLAVLTPRLIGGLSR